MEESKAKVIIYTNIYLNYHLLIRKKQRQKRQPTNGKNEHQPINDHGQPQHEKRTGQRTFISP